MDLAFIIDASGSIRDQNPSDGSFDNWNLMLQFLTKVVDALNVGGDEVRIGVVSFSEEGILEIPLNKYYNPDDLKQAILDIQYTGMRTNTAGGIETMRLELFTSRNGDRSSEPNVVIVLTDGNPTIRKNDWLDQAEKAKNEGIKIFSVGITDAVNVDVLKGMSTGLKVLNVDYFVSPDFNSLSDIISNLIHKTCDEIITTPKTTTTVSTTASRASRCDHGSYLTILLDTSGSIGESDFTESKNELTKLMADLPITEGVIKVALVTFGDTATMEFRHARYDNVFDVIQHIQNLEYKPGTTNMKDALKIALDTLNKDLNINSVNERHIVLTITDGIPDDLKKTLYETIRLKSENIHMISIGIGQDINTYVMYALSSYPENMNSIYSPFFNTLAEERDKIRNLICNNVDECMDSCINNGICEDHIGFKNCRCGENYGGIHCDLQCSEAPDVLISIDKSGSISQKNFDLMKAFITSFVINLPLRSNIALQSYSNDATYHLDFSSNRPKVLSVINSILHDMGSTNLQAALKQARSEIFLFNSIINDNTKIMIFFTDNQMDDQLNVWEEARLLREDNVKIVAFGINTPLTVLRGIVSFPYKDTYLPVIDYTNMNSNNDNSKLLDIVCNNNKKCNNNPCVNGFCSNTFNSFMCSCEPDYIGRYCDRRCLNDNYDLVFLIDVSHSTRIENFESVKLFFANFLENLHSQLSVNIGTVSFADRPKKEFDIGQYTNIEDIQHAILSIEHIGGRTNIAGGLDEVGRLFSNYRSTNPQVLILFSDGNANIREKDTIKAATNLRVNGIHIISVAVGEDADVSLLKAIISKNSELEIPFAKRYGNLNDQLNGLIKSMCKSERGCDSIICQNDGQCTDNFGHFTCDCHSRFTGEFCERTCLSGNGDVVFILDVSGSIEEYYDISLYVMKQIIYGLNYSNDRFRVAVIIYGDEAELLFDLEKYSNVHFIVDAIRIKKDDEKTNLQAAITLANERVFRAEYGDRYNYPNYAVVITDGKSNVEILNTLPSADSLKRADTKIYTVGLGKNYDKEELERIASQSNSPYVLDISEFSDKLEAMSVVNTLLDEFC
ncbi:Cochlin [Intoshia linei]|uniref:Cochlin n=1 Tax=Intoshia linei TaxID=1819745 RepID=A0A177B2J5_9BILA|nr:Cochlin [Intoshia linei]